MAILGTLKSYWSSNATLTAALPVSQIYLDFVPPSAVFPYCRLTVLSSIGQWLTSGNYVRTISFQLMLYGRDDDALNAIADVIEGQLNQSRITSPTLIVTNTNRIPTTEIIDGNYTFGIALEYEWSYNSGNT